MQQHNKGYIDQVSSCGLLEPNYQLQCCKSTESNLARPHVSTPCWLCPGWHSGSVLHLQWGLGRIYGKNMFLEVLNQWTIEYVWNYKRTGQGVWSLHSPAPAGAQGGQRGRVTCRTAHFNLLPKPEKLTQELNCKYVVTNVIYCSACFFVCVSGMNTLCSQLLCLPLGQRSSKLQSGWCQNDGDDEF